MEGLLSSGRRIPGFWILIALAVLAPCAFGLWNAVTTRRKIDAALHAADTQSTLDRTLNGVTCLRVWGAGIRTRDGKFCGCAIVPKPERVFYETTDPAEIGRFLGLLRPRPYLTLEPPVSTCGQVTIDFLRGEQLLLSVHLRGRDLHSTKGTLPITDASCADIEVWLKQHSIRERILAAMYSASTK